MTVLIVVTPTTAHISASPNTASEISFATYQSSTFNSRFRFSLGILRRDLIAVMYAPVECVLSEARYTSCRASELKRAVPEEQRTLNGGEENRVSYAFDGESFRGSRIV